VNLEERCAVEENGSAVVRQLRSDCAAITQ
jgi:hypothetical protein